MDLDDSVVGLKKENMQVHYYDVVLFNAVSLGGHGMRCFIVVTLYQ